MPFDEPLRTTILSRPLEIVDFQPASTKDRNKIASDYSYSTVERNFSQLLRLIH